MSSQTLRWNDHTETAQPKRPDWVASVPPYRGSEVAESRSGTITRNDDVWGGVATVAGSRVPVFMIADLAAEGLPIDDIRRRYPHLTPGDIYGALSYAHTYEGVVAQERARYRQAIAQYRR